MPGQGRHSRAVARERETEILHGAGRSSRDADETEILRGVPGTSASDADETAVLPSVAGTAERRVPGDTAADPSRPAPDGKGGAWSAFDRPTARGRHAGSRSPVPGETPGETRAVPTVRDPWNDPWSESEQREGVQAPPARVGISGDSGAPEQSQTPAGAGARGISGRPGASGASAAFDEPAGPGDPAATHDPHEVTVQLDAVAFQRDHSLRAAGDGPGGGEGSDGPVFVDESGRRSRRFRRIGMAVGLACAVYAVVIVATLLSGNSDAPWLPVEGPREKPAGKVDTSPLPAESAPQPSATGSVSPGTSPTASTGTTPSPGASATAPGASATAENPGTSADPKTSAPKPTTDPGTDPTVDPDPTTQPTTSDPDPSPTDGGGPTEEPTDPATTEGPAAGPVANGPSDPTPIAQEPDLDAAAPAASSPEYTL
ncbi:hypothetical protein [Streptomyces lanatus]|uniref:Translation initiation factor IF-2 n=1 Tax=Streptomyces lanatus TaxID=66900 RepID=A0ABV1Y1S6_9ACTN|nr:hypothetical protein [Streptomyces lanatus]